MVGLLDLPEELLLHIVGLLSLADQCNAALVCVSLARVTRDRKLTRLQQAKLLRRLQTGDAVPATLVQNVTAVKLPWVHVLPSINEVMNALALQRQAETFDASHCYDLSPIVLSHLKKLRNLHTLDISCNKRIADDDVQELLLALRNLSRLVLRKCIMITDTGLTMPPSSFSNLRELDIRGCSEITGKFLEVADVGFPNLRSLLVCRITNSMASYMSTGAPLLEELVAQDAHELTDNGFSCLMKLKHLSTIKLYHCWLITINSIVLLNKSLPKLKNLVLKGNRNAHPDFMEMTSLTQLHVLRLSWKNTLKAIHLRQISSLFRHLTKLNLSGCHEVDDDALLSLAGLPLTILKLLDVPLVTDRGFGVVLKLPKLVKLVTGWTFPTPPQPPGSGRDLLGLLGWRTGSNQSMRNSAPVPGQVAPARTPSGAPESLMPLQLTFLRMMPTMGPTHLQTLRLHHYGNRVFFPRTQAVTAISEIKTLQELHLCCWGVTDDDAVLIAKLTGLTVLVLSASELTQRGVKLLGESLRGLYRLDLRLSHRLICKDGEGLTPFATDNHPLHTLCLANCLNLHPTALRVIGKLMNLHCLDLTLTRMRSFDLRLLVPLLPLRKLQLSGCPQINVVDALRALHHARHLHTIDLLGCQFEPEVSLRDSSSPHATQMQWETLRRPFVKVLAETQRDPSRTINVSPYV